jgi:hypothetical protein
MAFLVILEACGGGATIANHNIRPSNNDGSGNWSVVSSGQPQFVVELGADADIIPATDIALPNKANKQAEQDALNDLAANQLVYFSNRTSFDPKFFDDSDALRTTNYAIRDVYTLNSENGGSAIYLKPVAGDPLNDNSHTVVDTTGKSYTSGVYYAFTDASGNSINLDPAQNQIVRATDPRLPITPTYILGNNVRLHIL